MPTSSPRNENVLYRLGARSWIRVRRDTSEEHCEPIPGGQKCESKSTQGNPALVGGLVIGILALLIIGSIVAFCLWRRSRRNTSQSYVRDAEAGRRALATSNAQQGAAHQPLMAAQYGQSQMNGHPGAMNTPPYPGYHPGYHSGYPQQQPFGAEQDKLAPYDLPMNAPHPQVPPKDAVAGAGAGPGQQIVYQPPSLPSPYSPGLPDYSQGPGVHDPFADPSAVPVHPAAVHPAAAGSQTGYHP